MRSKAKLYKREQSEIISKIVEHLNLENISTHILYDLDKNDELKINIMNLSSDIKKYYNCNNIKAVTDPSRIKRPWLSIIKTLLKPYYEIVVEDHHFTQKDPITEKSKYIHSQKYTFHKKSNVDENSENDDSPCGVADLSND